jgi:hypothetical protein
MTNRYHSNAVGSSEIIYRTVRGDDLLQDKIFAPETIRRGLDIMAAMGVGELAYSPVMLHEFEVILARRFGDDDGGNTFEMPNYGVYEDPSMADFYGVDTSLINFRTEKETQEDAVERLLQESAKEAATQSVGLAQMMNLYATEEWARHGISDETPYVHSNADLTLFRNPTHEWATIDRPISTNDKHNIIEFYGNPDEPLVGGNVLEHVHPTPHPAFLVDSGLYQ